MNQHHAFVIEAEAEAGIATAQAWAEKNLNLTITGNPDVVPLRYGLFSVDDARKVSELASGAPFAGDYKVIIIAATRAYHEAQNALLKLFEEPPKGAYLFFILPSLGGILPTLRSRVQVLQADGAGETPISKIAEEFIRATKEKRSALIKRLATGADEEERREHRDEAIAMVNGIEAAAYAQFSQGKRNLGELLSDIAVVRGHLYDRSAPMRMILEHLSLVLPASLKAPSRSGPKNLL